MKRQGGCCLCRPPHCLLAGSLSLFFAPFEVVEKMSAALQKDTSARLCCASSAPPTCSLAGELAALCCLPDVG